MACIPLPHYFSNIYLHFVLLYKSKPLLDIQSHLPRCHFRSAVCLHLADCLHNPAVSMYNSAVCSHNSAVCLHISVVCLHNFSCLFTNSAVCLQNPAVCLQSPAACFHISAVCLLLSQLFDYNLNFCAKILNLKVK